jgi:adenylylsulfate kinase-like enzyme
MLWDYDCYGRLPGHIDALDVGAFTARGELMSVAAAKEFFLLTEWSEGATYHKDLERMAGATKPTALDRKRTGALAGYLADIHRVKQADPQLYRRRLRELLGHGECIMGLTDSYPDRFAFITEDLLQRIEVACNVWRWRLRSRHARLSQVHGDFHPWNVLFRHGTDFSVLDRSRGEWGEPADDVTSMSINYLFFSLCRHGTLRGALEVAFHSFWETYLARSRDHEVLEATAPFFRVSRVGAGESALVSETHRDRAAENLPVHRECPGDGALRPGGCEPLLRMSDVMTRTPFAIWLTGLPASGKSSIVARLVPRLESLGSPVEVLESDAVRRMLTPEASYSHEERDLFYRALAFMGSRLVAHGVSVIFDATASRREYREFARSLIPRLLEISIECPLEVCMQRDKKGTYKRGLEGGSSTVPGLQAPYEAPVSPALAIDTTVVSPDAAAERILELIRSPLRS